jgi:hypothetical protein
MMPAANKYDMSDYQPFFSPKPKIPAQQEPMLAAAVWRLRLGDRAAWCELRDHSKSAGGWELHVFENGRPLFSRRCVNERGARYLAETFRKDLLRVGWRQS